MNKLLRALFFIPLLLLVNCATFTSDEYSVVSVQTKAINGEEVVGVRCELVNEAGKFYVTTPGTIQVPGDNDDMIVTCRKEGYQNGSARVISEIKGNMFANIILGGGIGAFIDHSNGSAYRYPSFIEVTMGDYVVIGEEDEEGPSNVNAMGQSSTPTKNQSKTESDKKVRKVALTTEEKLKELKRLKDEGLIDQETYDDYQEQILNKEF